TVRVSTYTCPGSVGPVSTPTTVFAFRLPAVAVIAPDDLTTVPAVFVRRMRTVTAVPAVPTVQAAKPSRRTPRPKIRSPLSVSCATVVSVVSAGDATTVPARKTRGDRSTLSASSRVGTGDTTPQASGQLEELQRHERRGAHRAARVAAVPRAGL